MPRDAGLPPGTLMMLVLRVLGTATVARLRDRATHPPALGRRTQRRRRFALPALQKLLVKGWVKATWRESDSGRQVREYRLTASGKQQLEAEIGEYRRMTGAIDVLLKEA